MKVHIFCYAQLKEYFSSEVILEISEEATISDVCHKLLELSFFQKDEKHEEAKNFLSSCRVAISEEFVERDSVLGTVLGSNGGRIDLLPPYSGG